MRDRRFLGYVLCAGLGTAPFFTFLGGGPHVVVSLMGRTSAEYGLWFAINAFGYLFGNFIAARYSSWVGIDRMIWWGLLVSLAGVALSVSLTGILSALGTGDAVHPAADHLRRQRIPAAEFLRRRGQRAAAGGGRGFRHRRLYADGNGRAGDASRRPGRWQARRQRCRSPS